MHSLSELPRPWRRPRRLRRNAVIRGLVRETSLKPSHLVLPLFTTAGQNVSQPIGAMPGHARLSVDLLAERCEEGISLGVGAFALFPAIDPSRKTPDAQEAVNPDNLLCQAVRALKQAVPEAYIVTDIALDPYSSHGHDGLVSPDGVILNDESVEMLARMAVLHAEAGTDMVAPSDMMDGRVAAIRAALDAAGAFDVAILSYTAKYASGYYGPFREALDSAPAAAANVPKDKKTYQMDPANAREASVEALLDEDEGADILMVKPALPYLDVISRLRNGTDLPIAAYQVSGEYSMVKAAAARGWLDYRACMTEALCGISRAGADLIFSYAALDYARWWRETLG
ncbi:MAG: delta-aminolevulinic acid dehydratase [Gemmatimonas sp. SG8_17]|nr:MAG: delta-aminolevulinic acid dehydratase [Gemmatimonas sp. SG8_17]